MGAFFDLHCFIHVFVDISGQFISLIVKEEIR